MSIILKWMSLYEAIQQTEKALSVTFDDACIRVAEACKNEDIRSQGAAPLNSSSDKDKAWKLAEGRSRIELLRPDDWNQAPDFHQNIIGRYRNIGLNAAEFWAWLKNTRKSPVSKKSVGRPSGSLIDDTKRLAKIKALVKKGVGVTAACQQVAAANPGHSKTATIERLRKKQRNGKVR